MKAILTVLLLSSISMSAHSAVSSPCANLTGKYKGKYLGAQPASGPHYFETWMDREFEIRQTDTEFKVLNAVAHGRDSVTFTIYRLENEVRGVNAGEVRQTSSAHCLGDSIVIVDNLTGPGSAPRQSVTIYKKNVFGGIDLTASAVRVDGALTRISGVFVQIP
jgi:hypothetical protein